MEGGVEVAATAPPGAAGAPDGPAHDADVFAQHDDLHRAISSMYVNGLKNVLRNMRGYPEGYGLSISGNKADLVVRIQQLLVQLKTSNNKVGYARVKSMCLQENPRLLSRYAPAPRAAAYNPYPTAAGPSMHHSQYPGGYVPPKWPAGGPPPARPVAGSSSGGTGQVQFKSSPFYKVVSITGNVATCETAGYSERKSKVIYFSLTPGQKDLLRERPTTHQLRLFSIPGSQYDTSLRTGTQVYVEFPQTCEARVNGTPLSANLRGTKKSSVRTPPNVDKDKALTLDATNRVEFIYSNSPQRYTIIVALCKVTSAADLADKLRATNLWTKETVLSKMNKAVDDDDIVSGEGTLSLKCPLSYMRIQTPCRSHMCTHQQCFDAHSFFSMNEQTPNWICPVCSKKLVPEHLIVDGYFDDILQRVPASFESVISEPSGDWHTADGRYTLSGEARPVAAVETMALLDDSDEDEKDPTLASSPVRNATSDDVRTPLAHERNGSSTIALLDTPDSPSSSRSGPTSGANTSLNRPREIIDLTLDSDDDAPPPKRTRLD